MANKKQGAVAETAKRVEETHRLVINARRDFNKKKSALDSSEDNLNNAEEHFRIAKGKHNDSVRELK